jgi:NitT/TauT family transport system substrate-binding protein
MSSRKFVIQPGVWVILIAGVLVGTFFGINSLKKSGALGKITQAVAPSNNVQTADMPKPIMVGGQKPLLVAINTWPGFAPGVYMNGGFEPSQTSRYYKEFGLLVQFVKMDDFGNSRIAWSTDRVDIICNTADVLSTELPNFSQFKPKVFMQIDWSRGGDKMVVRPGINSIADLKGKKIAVAISSPSQTLLIRAIESGQVAWSDIKDGVVSMNTAIDAASAYKNGKVDAALVWSPDDEDCISAIPGSKVLISTKEAKYVIADIFYTKDAFLKSRYKDIQAFTEGWLKGAQEINSSIEVRKNATALMSKCFNVSEALMNFDNARFCTYGDNVNFFNILPVNCKCVKGEDLYTKMAAAFNKIGYAPDNVQPWRDISDISILQSLSSKFTGPEHAAEESETFTKPTTEMKTMPAVATKRIIINFASGSYTLSDEAKYIISRDFSDDARGLAGFRVRVEGNTDNIGSDDFNRSLSKKRAQAVVDYLVTTYTFDKNRFIVVGNGSDKPITLNDTEAGRAQNRNTAFEMIQAN